MKISMKQKVLLGIAFILFLTFNTIVSILVDILWFQSLNYSSTFWTIWGTKIQLILFVFTILVVFFVTNILIALKFNHNTNSYLDNLIPNKKILRLASIGFSCFLAFLISITTHIWWTSFLQYLNQTPFNITDPIFNLDLSFYFFSLPFYNNLKILGFMMIVFSLIFVVGLYFIQGFDEILTNWNNPNFKKPKVHIAILVALLMVLMSVGYVLDKYDNLYSEKKIIVGMNYTDVHAGIIGNYAMAVVCIVVAILILIASFHKHGKIIALSTSSLFFISTMVFKSFYPSFQQRYIVEPNELEKEKPYIENNIKFTQLAYNLNHVEVKPYPLKNNLTKESIETNKNLFENVRLWDWRPALSAYKQLQEIRSYYNFNDIDIDRYNINGKYRQVMLAPRELAYNQVPEQARTWVNQRLQYTHGYGVAMSPVNTATSNGLPEFIVKDIPPVTETDLKIEYPQIYYGEDTNHYIFTGTTIDEFDYPLANQNQVTKYQGNGGVRIDSFFKKVLFSFYLKNIKLFISEYFNTNTKIHYNRNIVERVQKIAPFLRIDKDPYIVLSEGKLYWILDTYTVSNKYPYARTMNDADFNYIRNSVKVIIDAYHGSIQFVITDESDPIIQTYRKIFPTMWTKQEDISKDLVSHFRYPQDLFKIQASIYSLYHMEDSTVFYNKEDVWKTPTEIYEGSETTMEPYYVIMQLPNATQEEFILIQPFSPVSKNNMIAWMAGSSDNKNYGKLTLYEFPKKELIYGPMQIEAKIDQDPVISEQLTLWSQKGSNVIRGNLVVMPIDGNLIYIEPLYLRSEQGQMPELKRVIVAYQDVVVMRDSLSACLNDIFGTSLSKFNTSQSQNNLSTSVKPSQNLSELADTALKKYLEAQQSLKQANWEAYGKLQNQLEQILRQLKTQSNLK